MPGFTAEKPNLRADKALVQYAKGMAMTPLRTSVLKQMVKVLISRRKVGESEKRKRILFGSVPSSDPTLLSPRNACWG